ncbi:MAG: wax ester/triacylglycerol synthase family O-acyltransferase [Acidimicrobiia bacterium]
MRFERRMSDSDALMWHIEKDPLLRSTITAIAVLDSPPERDRLVAKIERALRDIPRLRQRVVSPPFAVAPPEWVDDPDFDLNYHLRWLRSPAPGSFRQLLDLAAPIAMQSFDRARPLWEFTVVEGLEEGRAALIQKVHHSVTDGVGGMKLALMLLDLERDAPLDTSPLGDLPDGERPTAAELLREGVAHQWRRQLGIARRSATTAPGLARNPAAAAKQFADAAASAARLLTPAFEPLSPLMQGRSLSVHFETVTSSLPDLKAAAKRAGGKLNDAFMAAIAGGFRRYHEHHGEPVEALRVTMPINTRGDDTGDLAGNSFAPARFRVPISIADPIERMQAIQSLVQAQRREPALAFADSIAGVLNRLPASVVTPLFGSMLKGVDFVASNVPGAPFPVYLAGAKVEAQYAMGPLTGAATNLTLLSYVDEVHVGVNTDPAAIPDPDVFANFLREGFEEVCKSA